jgi:HEPN domain-containing protein
MRIREAGALHRDGHNEAAYYLARYSVECALKACIAKQVRRHDFPDRKLAMNSYTHDLTKLIGLAGLRSDLQSRISSVPDFAINWAIVKDWSVQERYTVSVEPEQAENLISAINDNKNGVLTWLRTSW